MTKRQTLGVLIAIIFQLAVLVGMTVKAALPLWTGTEIKLRTIPVDPRSLFRGNYALLRYEISNIDRSELAESQDLRNGEVVYLALSKSAGDIYEYAGISLQPPDSGLYIRGRITNRRWQNDSEQLRIKFGIEAYFSPKEKALALEKKLRSGALAVVNIAANGQAALKDVITSNSQTDNFSQ